MDRKMSKGNKLRYAGIVIFGIEVIGALFLTFILIKFPVLPARFMALYILICGLLLGVTGYFLISRKGFKRKIVCMNVAVLAAICFFVSFGYLEKTRKTLNSITGDTGDNPPDKIAVMVLESDPATVLKDTLGYKFGLQNSIEYEKSLEAAGKINNIYSVKLDLTAYNTYSELAIALLKGEVGAIIIDSSFVELVETYEEGFADKTRILTELELNGTAYGIVLTPTPSPTLPPNVTPTPTPEPVPSGSAELRPVVMPPRDSKTEIAKNYFTVYFSGIDTYGPINRKSRSDVNIVMTVNPKTKKILLVSIPRDAYAPIPGVSGGSYDKLTHAGLYGIDKSMNTLRNIYGVELDYYVRVNFSSVEKFVDILGGITVNSPANFKTGGYTFKKGPNFVDGKKALTFARERYSFASGDVQRGKNQMEVIRAVINKMMSPALLTNFGDIMNAVSGNFQTNLTMDQLTSLVRMQLDDGAVWNIETYTVATKGGMNYCYSYRGSKLYVAYIDEKSADEAGSKMREIMEGR